MHTPARRFSQPTTQQIAKYQSHGFEVIHLHTVNVNPLGERVDVDLSATDPTLLVQVAVKAAYEAGLRAGEAALQAKLRSLLGVGTPCDD